MHVNIISFRFNSSSRTFLADKRLKKMHPEVSYTICINENILLLCYSTSNNPKNLAKTLKLIRLLKRMSDKI